VLFQDVSLVSAAALLSFDMADIPLGLAVGRQPWVGGCWYMGAWFFHTSP
jgi:hypothetical protein